MDPFLAKIQTNYLKDKLDKIGNSAPDEALVATLKEILRNQVPTAWHEYEELYRTAVACVTEINLYHPELMGRRSDKGSLYTALSEFATQAQVIATSGIRDETSCDLELLAMEVANIANDTADYFDKVEILKSGDANANANNQQADPQQVYVDFLRDRCFDFVDDFCKLQHTYAVEPIDATTMETSRLYRELAAYKTQLPVNYASSIIVRASSKQLHLVRACIIGPQDTPYANGVFFFDFFLKNYPHQPPQVKFLTTNMGTYRQNPNLYECGKVCLSLLGTWHGEPWQPGKSTLLQILVSIQSAIFNAEPFFNEPGYEESQGTPRGDQESQKYNASLYRQVADAAILQPLLENNVLLPYQQSKINNKTIVVPPEFEDIVQTHFQHKRYEIEQQLTRWAALPDVKGMDDFLISYQNYWRDRDLESSKEMLNFERVQHQR